MCVLALYPGSFSEKEEMSLGMSLCLHQLQALPAKEEESTHHTPFFLPRKKMPVCHMCVHVHNHVCTSLVSRLFLIGGNEPEGEAMFAPAVGSSC